MKKENNVKPKRVTKPREIGGWEITFNKSEQQLEFGCGAVKATAQDVDEALKYIENVEEIEKSIEQLENLKEKLQTPFAVNVLSYEDIYWLIENKENIKRLKLYFQK